MSHSRQPRPEDVWERDRGLGSGGFGVVELWKNKSTGQELALKKVKHANQMTSKHRDRWLAEINILLKLDHGNVIKSVEVPASLAAGNTEENIPPMAMEYCEGGSLRQVLIQLENCCGLREKQVREVTMDIGSAVQYLHSNKVIHRDIKPDNIVLTKLGDRMVYKLIDLGYAKEINSDTSICNSFVGTMQYLAPEFMEFKKRYTATVDYWSFGVSVFECIANYRPFLHSIPLPQWYTELNNKPDTCICAKRDIKANLKLIDNIPQPHFLCRTTQQMFEKWLRLMLRWDGKKRGGEAKRTANQLHLECFVQLDVLLNTKIFHLFYINADQYLTYAAMPGVKISELMPTIAKETKVPVAEQKFIMGNGYDVDPRKTAESCCQDLVNEEDMLVFLLRKNQSHMENPHALPPYLTDKARQLLGSQGIMMDPNEQIAIWASCSWVCAQASLEYKRLFQGQRAIALAVYNLNKSIHQEKNKLQEMVIKLESRQQMFQSSLQLDLQMAADRGIDRDTVRQWNSMYDEVKNMAIKEQVDAAIKPYDVLSNRIMTFQSSQFARIKNAEAMEEWKRQAMEYLGKLKRANKEMKSPQGDGRIQLPANTLMRDLMKRFIGERKTNLDRLYLHLSNISQCYQELQNLMNKVHPLDGLVTKAYNRIEELQLQRQRDMWNLLEKSQKGGNGDSLSNNSTGSEKSDDKSLLVLNENEVSRIEVQSLMEDYQQQPLSLVSSLDWDFLDSTKPSLPANYVH